MKFNAHVSRATLLAAVCIVAFVGLEGVAADEAAGSRSYVISGIIVNDGRFAEQYFGNEDAGIPAVEVVPLYYVSGDRVIEMGVPFGAMSSLHRYVGPQELVFYHSPPSLEPGDPKPTEGARVKLPADSAEVVLLFFTENFERRLYRVVPLSTSGRDFPTNAIRIYNFSSIPLSYNLEGKTQVLKPNALSTISLDPKETYQRLRVAQYDEEVDRWRPVFDRHLQVVDGLRSILLVLPRPGSDGRRLMTRFISENYNLQLRNLQREDERTKEEQGDAANVDETVGEF